MTLPSVAENKGVNVTLREEEQQQQQQQEKEQPEDHRQPHTEQQRQSNDSYRGECVRAKPSR
jgi:hypothetical protein